MKPICASERSRRISMRHVDQSSNGPDQESVYISQRRVSADKGAAPRPFAALHVDTLSATLPQLLPAPTLLSPRVRLQRKCTPAYRKEKRKQNSYGTASLTDNHYEVDSTRDRLHEVLLANQTPKRVVKHNKLKSHKSKGSHGSAAQVVAGSILIATDKLLNTRPFGKSKILLVKADKSSGFLGLIINKHVRWDALDELEEGLQMLTEAPLSFGGPLVQRGMILVALTRRAMEDQYPQVLPGIYYLDQSATYRTIGELKSGNQSITDYWFFLGYSSWGWEQLFDEIAERAWNISDDSMTHFAWP
ncbi:hypothetical protein L484_026470 [Morus notabilis]|uniref:Uncharacterized protein n=1 Tax=Morus notabilis TaxID=981085 RepID=W9QWC2_9ROSA|nr:hypothetical protein L484_026470 [Morus notabilis]